MDPKTLAASKHHGEAKRQRPKRINTDLTKVSKEWRDGGKEGSERMEDGDEGVVGM